MRDYDVVVLGAGAAGLMCAMTAGARGRRVLVVDHAEAAGKKILISGGGRCNFTNLEVVPERFLSGNPHFARSALSRYTQQDFIALVKRHRIAFHEKTLGQLFCDGSAREIVAMLLAECAAVGVEVRLGVRVTGVEKGERFRVGTSAGEVAADSVVLATGGLSIPKMGATGFAHEVAARFGLGVVGVRPGLVPLVFAGEALALMQPLAGVAAEVVARWGKRAFREPMLFTHRGLSGPAVLQVWSYGRGGEAVVVDLAPERDVLAGLMAAKRARPNAALRTVLGEFVPARLAGALAGRVGDGTMAQMRDEVLGGAAALLRGWRLQPAGTEGYAKAEVTVGGVDTAGLSQKTMEAKAVRGLFVVGEAVDVTGWLGGYNFQWAWSSGWCAGMAA